MTVSPACHAEPCGSPLLKADRAAFPIGLVTAVAILSGCASTLPATVSVPVPISCIPANAPSLPKITPNAELQAMPDKALVLTIAAEREDLISYSLQADAVIRACR